MKKLIGFVLALLLIATPAQARRFGNMEVLGYLDVTAGRTAIDSSNSLPGTCTIGELYIDLDADTNGSLYICRDTNAWKEVDDDGAAGGGDLLADGSVPMTANWDVGNFDFTMKSLTGDGTIEGATVTEGGNAVWNETETDIINDTHVDWGTGANQIGLDEVCEGDCSTDVAMDITATNNTTTPLTLTGAASQLSPYFIVEDDSSATVFTVYGSGHTYNTGGFRTEAEVDGVGLWVHAAGEATPEHAGVTGSYDHTGGANGEQIFTKAGGTYDFEAADATAGNWILMTGANIGAIAEIKEFISTTQVIVSGTGWAGDLASQTFSIYKHPTFVSGDGYNHEFSVNSGGEFEVQSYDFTGSKMIEFENDVAADSADTLHIVHEANGFSNSDMMQLFYETGALQAADESQVIQLSVDESSAVGGELDLLYLETTDNTALEKHAIHVSVGFDNALHVSGATADDMDYGYEYTAGASPVDALTEFTTSDPPAGANNLEVFSLADDFILIGNDATFEVLQVILEVGSSKDLELEFYYSNNTNGTDTGVDGWTQFYPDDATQGFQQSGLIDWESPGAAWDEDDQAEAGEAITEGYYIAIKRTRVGNPPTDAIEDKFQIYLSQSTGMNIDGLGVVQLPYLGAIPTGGNADGKMWMESDGLHVYYNSGEQVLQPPGAIDTTAVDDATWSDGAAVRTWTFDNDATDTTMEFASGVTVFSHDITVTGDDVNLGADPADTGELNLSNGGIIAWEDATEATITHVDNVGLTTNLNFAATTYGSDGTVSDAELLYINSLSSNAQTQITNNAALVDTDDEIIAIINASPSTQIAHEAGGLEADVSGYSGLTGITGGATSEVDTLAELAAMMANQAEVMASFTITNGDTAIDAIVVDPIACTGRIPNNMKITAWYLDCDKSGDIVIDVWKNTWNDTPLVDGDSIAGTEKPTLSSDVSASDTSLSSMTADWDAGQEVCIEIESSATVTKCTLNFEGYLD